MANSAKIKLLVIAGLLVSVASVRAQDAFVQGPKTSLVIKVTSCVVFSVRDKSIRHDCTSKASSLCDGSQYCELPIGFNLTDGRDIDPVGVPMVRRLGKNVDVEFQCGKTTEKRGPNPQNNNATLILSC
jgi:hypothetical protein